MADHFQRKWERLPKRLQLTYFLIIAALTIGIATFLTLLLTGQISSKADVNQASLSIISGSQSYAVGDDFTFAVQLGADVQSQIQEIRIASLNYDPTAVQVESSGGLYQITPSALNNLAVTQKTVEVNGSGAQTGKIDLTFSSTGGSYTGGTARLAVVEFRVIKAGQTSFSFDPHNGNAGAAVLNSNGINILTSASGWTMILGTATTAPTATPTATPTPTPSVSTSQNTTTQSTKTQSTPKSTTSSATSNSTSSVAVNATPTPTATSALTPASSGFLVTKISGSASTLSILLYVGIAVVVTLIVFLIWFIKNKRSHRHGVKSDDDDDEDII
ncbi:MAG: cohesin domain-containing protein [Patescibacteria group bacterium]|jgi:hypothetical protein